MQIDRNTVVAITGAGSGLGAALAEHYANLGACVVIGGRQIQKLQQIERAITSANGRCRAIVVDVCDESAVRQFVQQALQWQGHIDIFINNAGVCAAGSVIDTPLDDWNWLLDTNLLGAVRACRAVLPAMKERGRGQIINIASFAGIANAPNMAAYNATKSALISLSETLQMEYWDAGIRVSVSCPTFFESDLDSSLRSPDPLMQNAVSKMIHRSGVSAAWIANDIVVAASNEQFLILHQGQSKLMYCLKRFSNRLFRRYLMRVIRTRQSQRAKRAGAKT